ncbi:hypothetical protein C5B96_09625 [Subtercola sp. Z020]|uniref:hypothetical protein n=1 Tax=Subtercola sp. Z020 TaxID=2080582 RepID=UPI000CE90067|nr:hypothetical protein [Subtercola sp. Z020]PPF82203.1 hypothetical protein C5B96_09625 [Subtercola sp. Z020]
MCRPSPDRRAVSAAALTIVTCALATALVFGGANPANALTFPSLTAADAVTPVIDDPPAEPDTDPLPTVDPAPAPNPSDEPAPSAEPGPPVEPSVDPPAPTEEPAPATEVPAPADPIPVEQPSEASVPEPDESGYDPEEVSGEETATPAPTVTPAPTPTAVVTATAAPAPAVELPFYPPPSAGTAYDTFPLLLAGTLAGLVLLLGFATSIFTRWRVRGLRGPVRSRVALPSDDALSSFSSRPMNSAATRAGLALPWSTVARPARDTVASGFALGLPRLSARDDGGWAAQFDAGFDVRSKVSVTRNRTPDFTLPFSTETAAAPAAETTAPGDRRADLQVFDKPKAAREQAAAFAARFGLPFGKRSAGSGTGVGNYDLGLPGTT